LLTDDLQSLPSTAVLSPSTDVLRGSDLNDLGEAGHGTGDPTCDGRREPGKRKEVKEQVDLIANVLLDGLRRRTQ
jgi:hypothetical protein